MTIKENEEDHETVISFPGLSLIHFTRAGKLSIKHNNALIQDNIIHRSFFIKISILHVFWDTQIV